LADEAMPEESSHVVAPGAHSAKPPAVTVGIPTYNRVAGLRRALRSVLAQSERDLEVIVSDDGSSEETSQLVVEVAAGDPRVRYLRNNANRGLTANFNTVLQLARGRYVMLLADDDYLEENYVASCKASLDADSRLALVSGSPIYHEPDGHTFAGRDINLLERNPSRRVCRYFGVVTDNICIYGLIRRSLIEQVLPMRNCLAGDWLLIARIAFLGAVQTNRDTHLHRSTDGTSANFDRTVSRMGLSSFEDRHPHTAIMRLIWEDIARDSPVYGTLPRPRRDALALLSAAQMLRTRPLGFLAEELPALRSAYRSLRTPSTSR
jgi:glycosyltransferase involved in cell wall biosynthesis